MSVRQLCLLVACAALEQKFWLAFTAAIGRLKGRSLYCTC